MIFPVRGATIVAPRTRTGNRRASLLLRADITLNCQSRTFTRSQPLAGV